uniref:Transposase putative n=1 Tax=Albugo laibachii Nc14 TaxID=890382 RepID=F0X0C9_9STRA|nr:transposase putative [Albugo laibachii Nc14]|eukprot:CCA27213.1 transposase putative [Albugo laibachii Nc14]
MELLEGSKNGRLQHGALKEASEKWNFNVHTVYRLWKRYCNQRADSATRAITFKGNYCNCGRKGASEEYIKDLHERMSKLKLEQRGDLRSLSAALSIPSTTLQRYVKNKVLRVHTVTLKPTLSEDQKAERVRFISSFIVLNPRDTTFSPMYDRVHLDEKWFFMKKTKRHVYLTPTEPDPYLHSRHKSQIPKIMFLCAVARPIINSCTGDVFDGRMGMWPFAIYASAQCASRNREAGTLVLNSFPANKETYKRMLIDSVLPTIKLKWPSWSRRRIVLRHDSATPHRSVLDAEFLEEATADSWDYIIHCQPPQSPDLNVPDLGFIYSIQSLQFKERAETLEEMLARAIFAFEKLSYKTLENTFLTLQQVMSSVLRVKGGNNYKLPRMHKDCMRRLGLLPTVIDLDVDLYEEIVSRELNASWV